MLRTPEDPSNARAGLSAPPAPARRRAPARWDLDHEPDAAWTTAAIPAALGAPAAARAPEPLESPDSSKSKRLRASIEGDGSILRISPTGDHGAPAGRSVVVVVNGPPPRGTADYLVESRPDGKGRSIVTIVTLRRLGAEDFLTVPLTPRKTRLTSQNTTRRAPQEDASP